MRRVSPERALDLARAALGVVFLVRTTPLVNLLPIQLARVRGPLLGWPEPGWPFAWGDLVLPAWTQIGAAIARTAAAALVLAGVRVRTAGLVAGVCGFVALSQDPFGFVYTLHALFLGTILLAAVDRSAEGARVAQIFVASIYAWSALAKLNAEWLSGDTLGALAEDGLVGPRAFLDHGPVRVLAAWGVIGAEIALPCALLLARTRRIALGLALVFHLVLEIAARPDVMGAVMASLLLVFLAS
jgi:hypothetical protein